MTNTNTKLLAESGDLEVYEGKEPAKIDGPLGYQISKSVKEKWLSTKKVVKMAEGELKKLHLHIFNAGDIHNNPIDVSDIVTEKDGLYYFYPPVDKEDETQEEPQHILWVEVLKMIENNKAAHLMKYFTIKRR